jgi:hypothetical protein
VPPSTPQTQERAEADPRPPKMTRRGMVRTAAVAAAGVVGGMLIEPDGVANAASNQGPASFTSSTTALAVKATNTGKGPAVTATAGTGNTIQGIQTATGPGAAGVRGTISGHNGTGAGVVGVSPAGKGVHGSTPSGYGVYGESGNAIGVRGLADSGGYGVFGDTGDGNGYGVYGEASSGVGVNEATDSGTGVAGSSSTGTGVQGASSSGYGVYGNSSSNYGVVGATHSGNGVYGQVDVAPQAGVVGRQEDASGNWAVYGFGNIGATGMKSAVVPAEDGGEHLTLYCMESPECWFENFGSASDVPFAYRIVARRKDVTAPRLNRVTLPHSPRQGPVAAEPQPRLPNPSRQER